MLTGLLEFKEKLKAFYAKGGIYIRYVCNFVLAFLSMFAMSRKIGGNGIISNPLICIALSIVCAFLPVNITVVIVTIYMIINLFTLSLELAMIALGVMIVIYLLYFRFAPKTGFIMILTPILFFLKLPYVVPVVAASSSSDSGLFMIWISNGSTWMPTSCPTGNRYYAFASGIMNLGVMLPGMMSGFFSDWLGYERFFIYVLLATIPSLLITYFIPFTYDDSKKESNR